MHSVHTGLRLDRGPTPLGGLIKEIIFNIEIKKNTR